MDQKTRLIQQRMEEARKRLVDRLHAFEHRADRKITQPANDALETVENVKESLSDVTSFYKNVKDQVVSRPWTMVGLSLLAGFGIHRLLQREWKTVQSHGQFQVVPQPPVPVQAPPPQPNGSSQNHVNRLAADATREGNGKPTPKQPDTTSQLKAQVADFLEEPLEELKTVAVDAARGFAWGMLAKALPDVFDSRQVSKVAPNITPPENAPVQSV